MIRLRSKDQDHDKGQQVEGGDSDGDPSIKKVQVMVFHTCSDATG